MAGDQKSGGTRSFSGAAAAPAQASMQPVAVRKVDDRSVDATLATLKSQYWLSEQSSWLRSSNKYYLRDSGKTLAFEDQGKRLVANLETAEVVRSMVELARAKGWSSIRITGSDSFKSKAWVEAQLLGLTITGYKPDAYDLEIVAQRKSVVESGASQLVPPSDAKFVQPRTEQADRSRPPPQVRHPPGAANDKPVESAQATRDEVPDIAAQALAVKLMRAGMEADANAFRQVTDYLSELAASPRIFIGTLIDHGPAHFGFEASGAPSYYARLQTTRGEKIVWGVDLPRAFTETVGASPHPGDVVLLAARGAHTVEVLDPHSGHVATTQRNTWYAEKIVELPWVAANSPLKPYYAPNLDHASVNGNPPPDTAGSAQHTLATVLHAKGAPHDLAAALSAQLMADLSNLDTQSRQAPVHAKPMPTRGPAVSL